ncbi:MAG TPA: hypothetical protein VK530_17665 [Candidatus Acidoferrum sp.]|nr:hypothetical protein [Candidatus Acidoferrum sp.]
MENFWHCLEQLPGLVAVPATWRLGSGEQFDFVRPALLRAGNSTASSFPCPNGCGCAHRVVERDGGSFVAVCECESWNCEDIPLTRDDVALLELNWSKLGRAVTKAFGCDVRETDFGLASTKQIASFASAALPVVLTIQHEREDFLNVVAQLVARLRERFILLAPTSRWLDANAQALLANAHAGFFDLHSHVELTRNGLRAKKSAGELFSLFLPQMKDAATDDEARGLFALVKAMNPDGKVVLAPHLDVFRLYCVEQLSRNQIAERCGCVPSLVSLRFRELEKKLHRPMKSLRTLSDQFERIGDSLADSRAEHIHRKNAIDESDSDDRD